MAIPLRARRRWPPVVWRSICHNKRGAFGISRCLYPSRADGQAADAGSGRQTNVSYHLLGHDPRISTTHSFANGLEKRPMAGPKPKRIAGQST
jgi:hypothetical protein